MRLSATIASLAFATLFACTGCGRKIGEPDDSEELRRPDQVVIFDRLYRENCSACHGDNGRGGPAIDLANPAYQALVDDASLKKWINNGMAGTQMPAFGESAGGLLTEKQVDALVGGIRKSWASVGRERVGDMPPYTTDLTGDAVRGSTVYRTACLSCHGQRRQQITDTAYLALVSDQALRTIVIAGRPDLGHPGWRTLSVDGRRPSDRDVTDLVTYLASLRVATPGQPYPGRSAAR